MFIGDARLINVKKPDVVLFIMVSFLPITATLGEMKTRPTQNAVRQLNSYGIQPDMIIARSEVPLDKKRKEKIAISCNVRVEHVISAPDIESIYEVPINFEKDHLGELLLDLLKIKRTRSGTDLKKWRVFVKRLKEIKQSVDIAIVGKYFDTGDFMLSDAYISVIEAVKFSCYKLGVHPNIYWINAKDFERAVPRRFPDGSQGRQGKKISALKKYDGIIVPGGFGETGIEGKLKVIRFAREKKVPYLGLCYGMQLALVEYARNVLNIKDAHTVEINPKTKNPVIDIMPEQKKLVEENKYGATMRLGAYPAHLKSGTLARSMYNEKVISERTRHSYALILNYI